MKTLNFIVIILGVLFASTSCNKCEVEDVSTGIIVTDGQLRIVGNPYGPELIRSSAPYGLDYLISNDGGFTYQEIDFEQYDLMVFPGQSSCLASFYRDVSLDEENQKVIYRLRVEDCGDCDQRVTLQNWVLIQKVPANYTAEFIRE